MPQRPRQSPGNGAEVCLPHEDTCRLVACWKAIGAWCVEALAPALHGAAPGPQLAALERGQGTPPPPQRRRGSQQRGPATVSPVHDPDTVSPEGWLVTQCPWPPPGHACSCHPPCGGEGSARRVLGTLVAHGVCSAGRNLLLLGQLPASVTLFRQDRSSRDRFLLGSPRSGE